MNITPVNNQQNFGMSVKGANSVQKHLALNGCTAELKELKEALPKVSKGNSGEFLKDIFPSKVDNGGGIVGAYAEYIKK